MHMLELVSAVSELAQPHQFEAVIFLVWCFGTVCVTVWRVIFWTNALTNCISTMKVKVKVKRSLYKPGQAL